MSESGLRGALGNLRSPTLLLDLSGLDQVRHEGDAPEKQCRPIRSGTLEHFLYDEDGTLIFNRSRLASASFVAILLCFSCSNSDNGASPSGAAGQSGGRGGEGGKEQGQAGKNEGQSGEGGNAGESAGASGEAGSGGGEAGASSGGSHAGGVAGTAEVGGSSGGPTNGGAGSGGRPGLNECVWDPAVTDHCPACDGNGDCARPGYKYVGSGAITASCCGFVWQEATAPGSYSLSEAVEYCASLSLLRGGWRLPKIAELFSLVDLSDETHTSPTIDTETFSDTLREVYWSSSLDGASGLAAWTVNFSDGMSQPSAVDQARRVRCVR